jgi:hypothetical protein
MLEVRGLKVSRWGVRPKGSWSAFVLLQDYYLMVMRMPQYPDLDLQLQKNG